MEEKEKDSSKKEQNIFEKLAGERSKWNARHLALTQDMRDIYKLAEMQVNLYSTIQEALENYHRMLAICSKSNARWRAIVVKENKEIQMNSDFKYKRDADKDEYIKNKHQALWLTKEATDAHLSFLKELLGDLRSMTYGVKYRIELEQFKRGGTDYGS